MAICTTVWKCLRLSLALALSVRRSLLRSFFSIRPPVGRGAVAVGSAGEQPGREEGASGETSERASGRAGVGAGGRPLGWLVGWLTCCVVRLGMASFHRKNKSALLRGKRLDSMGSKRRGGQAGREADEIE